MRKNISRVNAKYLFDSFDRPLVSELLGPRQVGKTTLINDYIHLHSERTWVSLNMDVLQQRNRVVKEELELMIEEASLQKIGG